ncbi:MAG: hypothetical protein AAEJ52_04980 [Myxococcota bacterium]
MVKPPKFCPECRDEYIHAATVCVDCDVPLVFEDELSDAEGSEELPPISELVCIRASSVGWAMALSEKLAQAGIPHRIQAAGAEDNENNRQMPNQNLPYGVFVMDEDVEAATEIDLEHTNSEIPDIPQGFDIALTEGADDACPACGDPIGVAMDECPGCGLARVPAD